MPFNTVMQGLLSRMFSAQPQQGGQIFGQQVNPMGLLNQSFANRFSLGGLGGYQEPTITHLPPNQPPVWPAAPIENMPLTKQPDILPVNPVTTVQNNQPIMSSNTMLSPLLK